jgi:hypothetical protein
MNVRRAFKDALTEHDGETFDPIKLLGMAVVAVFLVLSVVAFFSGKTFDAVAYGTGAGLVIAAMGTAIKLTEKPKPEPQEPPK